MNIYCGRTICVLCLWSRLAFQHFLAPIEIRFIHQFVLDDNQNPNIALKNGAIMGNMSLKLNNAVRQYFWDGLHGFIECSQKK